MTNRDVVAEKYNLPLPVGRRVLSSSAMIERFIKGLEYHDVTLEEIQSGGWRYCGGEGGHRERYFELSSPTLKRPTHKTKCVCGHPIQDNCYITNGVVVLVLGNVCVKRFLPAEKSGRTCSVCGSRHGNRNVNKCNVCK